MRNLTPEELKKLQDDIYNQAWMSRSSVWNRKSPTDIDAQGEYPYQQPEVDEQGTYYGYKILHRHCTSPACDVFVSPRYPAVWEDGELTSDIEPSERHMHGIHFTKRPNHPELRSYCRSFHGGIAYSLPNCNKMWVLVKCALSGTVVETEQGFRAQHAQIIGVCIDGYWTSYQDYQERTRAHSSPNPYYEDWEGKWAKGIWSDGSDLNPRP